MNQNNDPLWQTICTEAQQALEAEPVLASYFANAVLNHSSLEEALAHNLAAQLATSAVPAEMLQQLFVGVMAADTSIGVKLRQDLRAHVDRDPACDKYSTPLLYFKGFHALQAHRMAHSLWQQSREAMALYLQNQVSEVFAVDIHPGAQIGGGIMIDHATGMVIGETAVVEDNVSMLHSVTLGGTGCDSGDRHPKIRSGVLLSAGAKILGNIEIGAGVKVGAGSLVLESVPAHTTVAGVPAKIVGRPSEAEPALEMDQHIDGSGL